MLWVTAALGEKTSHVSDSADENSAQKGQTIYTFRLPNLFITSRMPDKHPKYGK